MPKAMPWADSLLAFQAVSVILFCKKYKKYFNFFHHEMNENENFVFILELPHRILHTKYQNRIDGF